MTKRPAWFGTGTIFLVFITIPVMCTSCSKNNSTIILEPATKEVAISARAQTVDTGAQSNYTANYKSENYERYKILNALNLTAIKAFHEGLAAAKDKNGLWGYVDEMGQWVIEPQYGDARDFCNDLALVSVQDYKLYIDKSGNTVLNDQDLDDYTFVSDFDANGTAVISSDGFSSVIDKTGNIIINGSDAGLYEIRDYCCGYRIATENRQAHGTDGATGVIDESGNWVVEPQYNEVRFYNDNSIIVDRMGADDMESGILSLDGDWIKEPDGTMIMEYGYGMVVYYTMTEPQKMELFDEQGNILLGGESYRSIYILGDNLIKCSDENNVSSLYWSDGTPALLPEYEKILSFDGETGEGIQLVSESDDEITFRFEKFSNSGEILQKSRNITVGREAYQQFCYN